MCYLLLAVQTQPITFTVNFISFLGWGLHVYTALRKDDRPQIGKGEISVPSLELVLSKKWDAGIYRNVNPLQQNISVAIHPSVVWQQGKQKGKFQFLH